MPDALGFLDFMNERGMIGLIAISAMCAVVAGYQRIAVKPHLSDLNEQIAWQRQEIERLRKG